MLSAELEGWQPSPSLVSAPVGGTEPLPLEEVSWSHVPAQVPCIWVIDDDPVNGRYIGEVLKSSNYRVESWESGQLAWEHLQTLDESEWPDLIICDWVMPGLSGVELCRRLKHSAAGQFVYFLLLTARSEVEDRVQGLDAGADEFIVKPVEAEELRARVRAGLRLQRLTRALAQANRQLRARNELLESLSLTDPLTGALNRRALDQALPHLLKQVGPRGQARYRYLCLLMMDVDYFKQVNDTYGHFIGDCVLQALVGRLHNQLRPSSLLYRYGGEEFVCVTPGLNPAHCHRYAESLRRAIASRPIDVSPKRSLPVTISIGGIVISEDDPLDPEAALQRADEALYQAKQAGRNCVRLFLPSLLENYCPPPGSRG
ncbi:diguanylate cyclase [Synechococcus sp. OH2]|uniref:GGDEF domain-containing response regulator n=1 Tax=Synechococcus sp. OH2 TaxID=136798 RepID=UPI0039C49C6C